MPRSVSRASSTFGLRRPPGFGSPATSTSPVRVAAIALTVARNGLANVPPLPKLGSITPSAVKRVTSIRS